MIGTAQVRELKTMMNAFGVRSPIDIARLSVYMAKTIWDPSKSDVGYGVTHLVNQALQEFPAADERSLAARVPELAAMFESGYDPALDPAKLLAMPKGSLGYEYARFIRDNGIDPLGTLLAMGPPKNLVQYVFRRAYKLHDILHVVLGCDTSILGEVRIVSFSLGQSTVNRSIGEAGAAGRAPAMALAVLFMNLALRNPHALPEAVRLAAEWMRLGERAHDHVAVRFEELFDRPVGDVRKLVVEGAMLSD